MGRKAKTTEPGPEARDAQIGDNVGLTELEQREALFLSHLAACRIGNKNLADIMEQVKVIRSARTKARNLAREEGFPLAKIDDILKKEGMSQKDLQAEADLFRWMDQMAGLPVGGQADMFKATPAEVKDGVDYEAEGYRAGIRAAEPNPRLHMVPPRFDQEWLKGYHAGQERNAWAMSEKGKIIDRRTDVAASHVPLTDAEAANEAEDDDSVIDEAAAALRSSSFMDTSAPDDVPVDDEEFQPVEPEMEVHPSETTFSMDADGTFGSEPDTFMDQVREVVGTGDEPEEETA